MALLAHIGNVPVEEWLPFLVPIVALYVYGRHRDRRRRAAVARLPQAGVALDEATVKRVLAAWAQGNHDELSREHLSVLYPPGPDGLSAEKLARRAHCDSASMERLLEQLAELDYVEFDHAEQGEAAAEDDAGRPRRVWLTFKGYEALHSTESALLAAHDERTQHEQPT